MSKKVLVTGASGLLGREIFNAFTGYDVVGTALSRVSDGLRRLDLTDTAATAALVHELRPAVIVHAAAERKPDVSEKDPEATWALNVAATEALAKAAREVGALLIYISTDYVFDGTSPPYRPTDTPNPLNNYGRSKLAGEKAVQQHAGDYVILRIPVLYGPVKFIEESPVTILYNNVTSGKPAKIDHWQLRYPTHTADVASVVRQIVESPHLIRGIFHFCGKEQLTKYQMAVIMAEVTGAAHDHLLPDPEAPPGAPRPKNVQFDTSDLEANGIAAERSFREAIAEVLRSVPKKE